MRVKIVTVVFIVICCDLSLCDDLYELLGVSRNADNRQIRQAFKKLALTLHPDKNKDDPDANEKFIQLNRAYEILKDEELRKRYDVYGESGFDEFSKSNKFHSWNYYYENFGIYDDDPEIITLSRSDFEQSVSGTHDVWFINFYSPSCSHCHHLAPAWRELARELDGVIRIGAVNCEEDWLLCRQQQINGYPSLFLYPQGEQYQGDRDTRSLVKYILRQLSTHVLELKEKNFEAYSEESSLPWLVNYCDDNDVCPSSSTMEKLSAMLDGLLHVAIVDCFEEKKLCSKLGYAQSGVVYFPSLKEVDKGESIPSNDAQEIFRKVLSFLPDMISLGEDEFTTIYKKLSNKDGKPWLVEFIKDSESDLQLRKLPSLLHDVKVGRVDCSKSFMTCQTFYVNKYPTFIFFKSGGSHEVHHGRQSPQDIAIFVQESRLSTVETLGPTDFPTRVVDDGDTWFVDFYAPWCPPCLRLLPEWRKASRSVDAAIHFGTVDCTIHHNLCQTYNINSYPTSILYNRSVPHKYFGKLSAPDLVEFVQDILFPPVISLNFQTFEKLVSNRESTDLWLVDFFAPWCQPCQQLAPEWRQLAKMVAKLPKIHVGQVDCTTESALCERQNIRSYPSIRLFPLGSAGTSHYHVYNGWSRDSESIRAWAFGFLPSKVKNLIPRLFDEVLDGPKPSLIDFYAPWCGHCQTFAPEFESIAQHFGDSVFFGKVDCEVYESLCNDARIRSYPSLRFYKGFGQSAQNGEVINSQNAATIIEILEEKLKNIKSDSNSRRHDGDYHDEL